MEDRDSPRFDTKALIDRLVEEVAKLRAQKEELRDAGPAVKPLTSETTPRLPIGEKIARLEQSVIEAKKLRRIGAVRLWFQQRKINRALFQLSQEILETCALLAETLYALRQSDERGGLKREYVLLAQKIERLLSDGGDTPLHRALRDLQRTHERDVAALRAELSMQRLASLQQTPGQGATPTATQADDPTLDAFYLAFEEHFRGDRKDLIKKLCVHLPKVEKILNQLGGPLLDLGSGRGEWIEMLRDLGQNVRGIDLNRCMIAVCEQRKLPVQLAEATQYLRDSPDNSYSVITGFHFIEHLPFAQLRGLAMQVLRTLQPGGLALFETPNPENILVGSNTFYNDLTHQRPLPPKAARFFFEQVGFDPVEIMELNPAGHAQITYDTNGSALPERLQALFHGPQDYAVLAYKATHPA